MIQFTTDFPEIFTDLPNHHYGCFMKILKHFNHFDGSYEHLKYACAGDSYRTIWIILILDSTDLWPNPHLPSKFEPISTIFTVVIGVARPKRFTISKNWKKQRFLPFKKLYLPFGLSYRNEKLRGPTRRMTEPGEKNLVNFG